MRKIAPWLVLCIATVVIMYALTSCGFTGFSTGKKVGTWNYHEPASVCDYKVAIIYRGQFRTEKDFYRSVTAQIEWLWKHNYIVLKVNYEWGYDMTRTLIIRFVCIKYREVKNEKK